MDKILERNTDGVVEHRVIASPDGARRVERVYPAEVFGDPVLMARVRERVQVIAVNAVPGVPRYTLEVTPEGRVRLSRPWVEGDTLRRLLEKRKFSESEALQLLRRVAVILDRLHAEGIVHGALTPKSIIVAPSGDVTLVNLRFVDTLPENLSFSEEHFAYMARYAAPETLTGDTGAKAADLYALGCILHETLTGRPPFENDDPVLTAFAHLNEEPSLSLESERGRLIIARLLRKNPAERPADAAHLLRLVDGAPDAAPAPADADPAEPGGRLRESWREVFGGRLEFGRGALLWTAGGLLLLLIPLVWFLNLGEYEITYRIDGGKLFRSRFDALFRPLLAALPEVRSIETAGEEAVVGASGEMDKLFIEKIDRLFASKLLPRCDLELSGSREVRIRFRDDERARQFERARLLLALKLQSRLQHHQVPRFSLDSIPPDRVSLRLPRALPADALRSLTLQGRLSIHLLLNPAADGGRTGETRLASAPRTGETLLANAVAPEYRDLSLAAPADVKATFALDDRPYALFFNMLGGLNLQDSRPRAAATLPAGLPLPAPPPPPAGAKLLVLKEDMAGETAIFSGRVARTAGDRFVYDLSDPVSRPEERPRPFSTLPLVIAVDGEGRAIVRNEAGLDPMRAVITGFPSREALFNFHRLVEAALPDYVEVDF